MSREIEDPPWYAILVGTFWPKVEVRHLYPPISAWRVRRVGRWKWVGEAMHPWRGEWVILTPRCWTKWQAKKWLSYYGIED